MRGRQKSEDKAAGRCKTMIAIDASIRALFREQGNARASAFSTNGDSE